MKSDRSQQAKLREVDKLSADLAALIVRFRVASRVVAHPKMGELAKRLDKLSADLFALGDDLAVPVPESLPLFEQDKPKPRPANPGGWRDVAIGEAIKSRALRKTLDDLGMGTLGELWNFVCTPASKQALSAAESEECTRACLDEEFGPDDVPSETVPIGDHETFTPMPDPPADEPAPLPPLPSWRTTPVEALAVDSIIIDYLMADEVVDAGELWDLIENGALVASLDFKPADVVELHAALVKLRHEAGDPAPMTELVEEPAAPEPPKRYIDVSNLPRPKRERKPKPVVATSLSTSTTKDPYPAGTSMLVCTRCHVRRSATHCVPAHPCPRCGNPEFSTYDIPEGGGDGRTGPPAGKVPGMPKLRTYEVVDDEGRKAPGHIQFFAIDDADAREQVRMSWPDMTYREITDLAKMLQNQPGSDGRPKTLPETVELARERAADRASSREREPSPPKPLKLWDVRDHTGAVLGHVQSTSIGGARNKANRQWHARPASDKPLKVTPAQIGANP